MPDPSPETLELRRALEAANRDRAAAVARATDLDTRLRSQTGATLQAQENAVDSAITGLEGDQARMQREWASLQEEGKFNEAGEVMRKMSDASAQLANLRGQKQYIAQQRTASQAQQSDPLANFSAPQREWISKNPRYLSDPAFKARVDAVAQYATAVDGVAADTPEWFSQIEKAVYPERQNAGGTTDPAPATSGDATADDPFSDTGDQTTDTRPIQVRQEHTLDAAPISRSQDAPAMRIELGPQGDQHPAIRQEEYRPAVGKGAQGEAIRSVAAPPSRAIQSAARRAAGGRQVIEPTQAEVEHAIALAQSIEPDSDMVMQNNVNEMVAWYYALAHSPTHASTRRKSWARDAVIG